MRSLVIMKFYRMNQCDYIDKHTAVVSYKHAATSSSISTRALPLKAQFFN